MCSVVVRIKRSLNVVTKLYVYTSAEEEMYNYTVLCVAIYITTILFRFIL